MPSKILATLILATYCTPSCFSQINNKQSSEASVETRYISKYDSLSPAINLELINHTQGLPEGKIECVEQSDDGYLWLSLWNYGLVRYDGYHFRSFIPVSGDSTGMPGKYIMQILKSTKKGLWLVTEKGLVWFDFRTFKSQVIPNLPKQFLEIGAIWSCIEDKLGQLWLCGRGLFLYHASTQSFEKMAQAVDALTAKPVNISNFFIKANSFSNLTLSPDGGIWLGGQKIIHVDPETKTILCYSWSRGYYQEILPDPDGRYVWFSGLHGIGRYNFKENSWLQIGFTNKSDSEQSGNFYKLSHIENGNLWMTNNESIKVMNIQNFATQLFKNGQGATEGINVVKGIDSIKWIFNEKQLFCSFAETKRFSYKKILPKDERVLGYWKDQNNNIEWFSTVDLKETGRLYKYDVKHQEIFAFTIPIQPCKPFSLVSVNDHELLIGVAGTVKQPGKLFLFDTNSFGFKAVSSRISNDLYLTTDSLEYLGACTDRQNNSWLSVYQNGLLKYETAKNEFHLVVENSRDVYRTDHVIERGNNLFCSKSGFIYLGGNDSILKRVNIRTTNLEKINTLTGSENIIPLDEDTKGNILVGMDSGLALYNPIVNTFRPIPGMPACNRAIFDSENNIIGLTENGLYLYNASIKTVRRFNALDGLKEEYSDYRLNTLNKSGKDEILISDFYRLRVNALYPSKQVAELNLTSITISGKELTSVNVSSLDTLILNHDENQLSFDFAALTYLPHEANSYACMLQRLDTNWHQLGSNNSITYANLSPGKYLFRIKTANRDGVWGKEKTLYIIIVPAFWQTIWFTILIVLIVAGFSYWLYSNHLSKLNLKNQLEREKLVQQKQEAEFQKRLGELTLSALRSQINPHFIFNCLNSIKLYATQNDINAASEYLTKFTRLIRQVLDNCKSEKISLAEELEVSRLYIEMEAMRFKDKLKYSISIEENIELNYVEIPPLLLQPYIENAIWHGLMNKEEGGHLELVINMRNNNTLSILIRDDGVGRAKASELKGKSPIQHKSFGLQITSERLALIKELYKTNTSVSITDLADENNMGIGTEVNIQIEIL